MASLFAGTLERTPYRPRLVFTDTAQVAAYTGDKAKHDFSTLTGAAALGLNEQWNEPELQKCVATTEEIIPALKGKLTDPAAAPAGAPTPGVSLQYACRNLSLLTAIAQKAGKELTYKSFQEAGLALGTVQIPGIVDTATYATDSPHGDIPARLWTYDAAARKFVTAEG